jgi:2-polyprenyl-3-methyl-5-hydroxy-6-metoxy-1,4-benzoquinol methylase
MTIRWSQVDSFPGNSSSTATTEQRPCPICGGHCSRTVLQFDQFQFYSDSRELPKRTDVREVQCLDCFALYLNPCYSEYGFRVLFAEAGRSYGSTVGHTSQQIDWLKARGLLRSGSQILDAGCYDGAFLARLPEDLEKIGVDIDGPAIERGRQTFGGKGIEFIQGDFESFRCDKSPDAITMFHVLEHLPRPVAVLRNLRSMAHAGTQLVVEVPILENGITNDINGFFTVQHTTHFTRVSLQNCLAMAGWKIIESVEHAEYNGCRVIASPAEPIQMAKQDPRAVSLLREYLASWNLAAKAVEDQLSELMCADKCVIWGGGAHTEFLYQTTSFFHNGKSREYAIVDGDPIKKGKSWRGIEIHSPDTLRELTWSEQYLLVSSYGSQPGIVKAATGLGVPPDRVVTLYKEFRVY